MSITEATFQEKLNRSKKHMMWFAIASLVMMFAGLTSAYVVSSKRRDWIDIDMPQEFLYSTAVILLSSLTLFLAGKAIKKGSNQLASILTVATFVLGSVFVYMQFSGFRTIINMGYYFTGPSSNVNASYIYILVSAHLLHIVVGLIVLIFLTIKTLMNKYTPTNTIGFEVGAIFWHFVDVLWIYLLLFLVFAKDIF